MKGILTCSSFGLGLVAVRQEGKVEHKFLKYDFEYHLRSPVEVIDTCELTTNVVLVCQKLASYYF